MWRLSEQLVLVEAWLFYWPNAVGVMVFSLADCCWRRGLIIS